MSYRGYNTHKAGDVTINSDTGEPLPKEWWLGPCGHCDRPNTPEGHDGCLGTIPGAKNACCGHGAPREAYVQFWNPTYNDDPNRWRIGGRLALWFGWLFGRKKTKRNDTL